MSYELLTALIGFAFITSIIPGPNNMMLLASGVNFGFWRTIPHILGISLGHSLIVLVAGLGLAKLFQSWPFLSITLKMVAAVYMCWLA